MLLSEKETFVEGVWGPYYGAIVEGFWLSEGGQSATGKLLDHVIDTHPASSQIRAKIYGKKLVLDDSNFSFFSYFFPGVRHVFIYCFC